MGYQTEEKYGTHLNIRYLRVFLMNLTSFYKFLVKIIRNFSMITMVKIYFFLVLQYVTDNRTSYSIFSIVFFLQNPSFFDSSIIFCFSALLKSFLWFLGVIGVEGAIPKL